MERDIVTGHGTSPNENGGTDPAAATDLHIIPERHVRSDHGVDSHRTLTPTTSQREKAPFPQHGS